LAVNSVTGSSPLFCALYASFAPTPGEIKQSRTGGAETTPLDEAIMTGLTTAGPQFLHDLNGGGRKVKFVSFPHLGDACCTA